MSSTTSGCIDFRRREGDDWAVRFDAAVRERILARDHAALVDYATLDPAAALAIPTPEHYLPLLYVLALHGDDEPAALFNADTLMSSISMTSVAIGARAEDFP